MHDNQRSLDILLEEDQWLLGLARRLVVDDATARDLVQDTWVAALKNPPSNMTSPRKWLAAVLNRLALRLRRPAAHAAAERADHESTHLGPEEQLVQKEAVRRLNEAVLALPEVLQSVLLLCHKQRLTQIVASAQLGVTERTVRKRLLLAHQHLRRLLGDEFHQRGDAPPTWQLAITPLLDAPPSPTR